MLLKKAQTYAIICTSINVFLIGFIVLMGWFFKKNNIIQISPHFAPMQFNTALGFAFSGISILLSYWGHLKQGKILISVVGILGFLTCIQYFFSISLGIDELFMEHYITQNTSHPGRMAPNTALCFTLTAISVWMLNLRKKINAFISSLIFGLGLTAFVGYIIHLKATYAWGYYTQMAVHTALGFMLIGLSTSLLNWHFLEKKQNTSTTPVFIGYVTAIAITILLIDFNTPLGIGIGTLYVVLILFSWFISFKNSEIYLGVIASILIYIGFMYSPNGNDQWEAVCNRTISAASVWVVVFLLFFMKKNVRKFEQDSLSYTQTLEQKNKELEQFVYISSHDLQEPLNNISSFTNFLETELQEKLNPETLFYLQAIQKSTLRMSSLIKGLLNYGRIGINTPKKEVDCQKIVASILDDYQVKDTTTIKVNKLPMVYGSEEEIALLFNNLISNALKFQPPNNKPIIEINGMEKGDFWEFYIKDNGIGIAQKHLEKIFLIFKRLHTRSKFEGTGVGLAQCAKIVEYHHGTIWVTSAPGKGSTFYFTLKKTI